MPEGDTRMSGTPDLAPPPGMPELPRNLGATGRLLAPLPERIIRSSTAG